MCVSNLFFLAPHLVPPGQHPPRIFEFYASHTNFQIQFGISRCDT